MELLHCYLPIPKFATVFLTLDCSILSIPFFLHSLFNSPILTDTTGVSSSWPKVVFLFVSKNSETCEMITDSYICSIFTLFCYFFLLFNAIPFHRLFLEFYLYTNISAAIGLAEPFNTIRQYCAVAGGRIGNGDVVFVFQKFWRKSLMQMDHFVLRVTTNFTDN